MQEERSSAAWEAESLTRRGLEESVRLLEEKCERATQRAERETMQRREAERRAAALASELATVRSEFAATAQSRTTEEGDRLRRELDNRELTKRLDAAMADRAALEARVHTLQGEVEVLAQRLEAEGRARGVLVDAASLAEREVNDMRERGNSQRHVYHA